MPESVLLEVQEELLDWNGLGLSVMEISHRSPEFVEIAKQAESDFRDFSTTFHSPECMETFPLVNIISAILTINFLLK